MIGEPILIMLVEDNPDHAELVMRALAEHRVANEVQHLLDGQAALDYLFRRGDYAALETNSCPHLILLDLRLPRVDGLEVLKTIKQSDELRAIPVVVLTTSEAEKDIARAYHHCANSYLVKPVGYAEFAEMLESLGFYWLYWNKYPQA
jgi:CheY-like chemotaxis protein